MTPRALAYEIKTLAPELAARPWDRHRPDDSLWWLVPSGDWPAYWHGKFIFDWRRARPGELFAGLNVEKGFGDIAADVFPAVRRKKQLLTDDWVWRRLVNSTGARALDAALVAIPEKWSVELRFEASFVRDPQDYDPYRDTENLYPKDVVVFERAESSFVAAHHDLRAQQLNPLVSCRRFVEMATGLADLPNLAWLWIDVYAGVSLPDPTPDTASLFEQVLSRFEAWVGDRRAPRGSP